LEQLGAITSDGNKQGLWECGSRVNGYSKEGTSSGHPVKTQPDTVTVGPSHPTDARLD